MLDKTLLIIIFLFFGVIGFAEDKQDDSLPEFHLTWGCTSTRISDDACAEQAARNLRAAGCDEMANSAHCEKQQGDPSLKPEWMCMVDRSADCISPLKRTCGKSEIRKETQRGDPGVKAETLAIPIGDCVLPGAEKCKDGYTVFRAKGPLGILCVSSKIVESKKSAAKRKSGDKKDDSASGVAK